MVGALHKSNIPGFLVQTIPMNLLKQKSCSPVGFTISWVSFPLHKKKPSISDLCRHYVTRWKGLCCMGGTLHRDSFIGLECQKAVRNLVAGNLHKTGTAFVTLGENRLGFVQFANQKTWNRLLTPWSYMKKSIEVFTSSFQYYII